MGKRNYRYMKYFGMVVVQCWKDTCDYFRGDIKNQISSFFGASVSGIVLYLYGPEKIVINQFWAIVLSCLGGGISWFSMVLIMNWLGAPTRLYRKREAEVFRSTWKDVEIVGYFFPTEYNLGVGLRIISHKPRHFDNSLADVGICDINPEIVSVEQRGIPKNIVSSKLRLVEIRKPHGPQRITGISNVEHEQELKYLNAIVLANWDKSSAWCESEDGKKICVIDESVACKVVITLNSTLGPNHLSMEKCTVTCELLYSKNKNEISILSIERIPAYEY